MVSFNRQYDMLLEDIITNGVSNEGKQVRTMWKTGESAYTKAVWGKLLRFKPEDGFPILTKKFVNPKSFTAEILWIMQKASNIVKDANELGTNVWNEWENKEGTIGKAYGYQIENNGYKVYCKDVSDKTVEAIGKEGLLMPYGVDGCDNEFIYLNQIDYVIHQLIDNPYSRQTITTLMNPSEHHEMELPPCVWSSHWEVMGDDKLYLSVKARSSDTFLGLPFNISQYALMHRLIAQVVGRELGDFVFTIDDAHLYDKHVPVAVEYLKREEKELPEFWIDKSIKSFQEFKYEVNFGWIDYTREKYPVLAAPIAIGQDEYKRIQEQKTRNK